MTPGLDQTISRLWYPNRPTPIDATVIKVSPPNGWRCPLVGGTRERRFDGTNSKPHKLLKNAQTPTTMAPAFFAGDRVHTVLARSGQKEGVMGIMRSEFQHASAPAIVSIMSARVQHLAIGVSHG